MIGFSFATAATIRFGAGVADRLADEVRELGARPFLVTGADPRRTADVTSPLGAVGRFKVAGEPTFDDARDAIAAARASGADVVVAVGGGAVLDMGKIVSILAVADGDPLDYAEVIGAGRKLPATGLPFVAVPTTAGTGSEVTANGVLSSPEHGVKVSLRSPAMLARVAVVDPRLTLSCPPDVTAASGMDALTQCIEPLTSRLANPLVEALALAGLRAAARGLAAAVERGDDLDARADMAFCSLMGGLSLANAKLGAVHGLAGVLGGVTGAAHGAICAALLAPTTRANIAAMTQRDPGNPGLAGYRLAAEALAGEPSLDALESWLTTLADRLGSPGLGRLGLDPADHDRVVFAAMGSSSMKGNPIDLTADELAAILEAAR